MKKHVLFLILIILSLSMNAVNLSYHLSMSEPHTHYFEVTIKVENCKKEYIDFKMPVWAPGSYLVREFPKNVAFEYALDKNNKPLSVKKINKNTWRVFNDGNTNFEFRYQVYAFEMSVRTSFLDADHGYLNGSSVFMYVDEMQDNPTKLTIEPYKEWKKITTSLERVNDKKWEYSIPNYDVFADSPIEIGNHHEFHFNASGVNHTVAMVGEANYDEELLKKDMSKIVEECTDIFGENPNKDYVFIIHNLSHRGGGLEHTHSTTLQVDRWTYTGENYISFLGLVAHEYFHLWNVKRLRPKALGPFDYEKENYTRQLWVMEGFTSYYDTYLLLRAGFIDKDEYLKRVAKNISRVENQPGSKVQPVSEASFDAWIKAYRPNENSYNTTISYYAKGEILALLIDLEIRKSTEGKESLDDFMKHLYNKFYKNLNTGFTEDEFKTELEEFVNHSMDDFFSNYVYGTAPIDYENYFETMGLNLVDLNTSASPSLGVRTKLENGKLIVSSVIAEGSAYKSGINAKDEIIAMNDYRVDSEKELSSMLKHYGVGDDVKFTLSRDGKMKPVNVSLLADTKKEFSFIYKKERTRQQIDLLTDWLSVNP